MKDINEIRSLWNTQPFLERLLFLMEKLRFSQEDAEPIAKSNFNDIADLYRIAIVNELNKN
jgi:hypothetical protein